MPRKFLLLVLYLCCLIAEAALAQVSDPILVGVGRDPKWSPSETSISLIRNDTLYVTRLDSAHETHAIHRGPIFKYEWLDDSTLVTHEQRYADAKDATRPYESIVRVSLSAKATVLASDDPKAPGRERRELRLMKFGDGSVGYFDDLNGQDQIVKLSKAGIADTTLPTQPSWLSVGTVPISRGKVWLYNGLKDSGRQITMSDNYYQEPHLAPTGDKIFCLADRGDLVVFDTFGKELANLGPGDMARWDSKGQYIVFCQTEWSDAGIEKSDIFLSRYDGTETVQLTATPDVIEVGAAFSPSSRYMIYSNERTGAIYVAKVR